MGYKRWMATITYRTESGPNVVDFDIEELAEISGIVEKGPHWGSIMDITIQLSDPVDSSEILVDPLEKI